MAYEIDRISRIENNLFVDGTFRRQEWRAAALSERMAHSKTPGVSIAVIADYRIAWARGYGVREAGKPDSVTPGTLFQAGSISKPVAAAAALRLVDEGRIDLDEDVNQYLRSWKVPPNEGWQPKVTLRQLLTHTAGTTVHGFPGYGEGEAVPTVRQVLDGEKPANTTPVRVNALPGTLHRYSGGGTTIVQQMLVDLLGKPFPELMRELVLGPLAMNDSTYEQPLPEARWSSAATAHPFHGRPLPGRWHTYPEMAAAGLWTTASDLARFAIELQLAKEGRSGRLFSPDMARQILSPQSEPNVGLGVFFENLESAPRFGHGGWDEGFVARLTASCDGGQGAVVMLNSNQGAGMMEEIVRGVAREYGWPGLPQERAPAEIDAGLLDACAGAYEAKPGIRFTVSRQDGRLFLQAPGQDPLSFLPDAGGKFYTSALDAELTFVRREDGSVEKLVLNQGGREMPVERRA